MELEHSPDRELSLISQHARERLVLQHARHGSGDLARSLASVDAILTLHHRVMTGRDRFILSGRRAWWALEASLASLGLSSEDPMSARALAGRGGWLISSRTEGVLASSESADLATAIGPALASAGVPRDSAGRVYVMLGLDELPSLPAEVLARFQGTAAVSPVTLLVDCGARPVADPGVPAAAHARSVHVDGNDHLALAAAIRAHLGGVIFLHTTENGVMPVFESEYAC